jgi:hypothetical protein
MEACMQCAARQVLKLRNGYGKIGNNLQMVLWLSSQPAKPGFYHRRTNLSRVLQLRRTVRLFTRKHVYQTRVTPSDGQFVSGFKSAVIYDDCLLNPPPAIISGRFSINSTDFGV